MFGEKMPFAASAKCQLSFISAKQVLRMLEK